MIVMNIFVRIMCSTFFTAHQGSRKTGKRLERIRITSFLPLCSDFLSVLEGEPHIVHAVNSHKIHQSTPESGIEVVHQFSLCQGFEESLYPPYPAK